MQIGILAFIVLFCVCSAVLIRADSRQGSRLFQELRERQLLPDTFVCCHCAKRKSINQLSTEINRMCRECADMYETVQDEP